MGRLRTLVGFVGELLSFGSPRAIVINLSGIFFALIVVPTEALIYSPFKCIFRFVLPFVLSGGCPATGLFAGCTCPACGMTRAMSRLLHGDVQGAWDFNKLVFGVFVVMAVLVVVNLYRWLHTPSRSKSRR